MDTELMDKLMKESKFLDLVKEILNDSDSESDEFVNLSQEVLEEKGVEEKDVEKVEQQSQQMSSLGIDLNFLLKKIGIESSLVDQMCLERPVVIEKDVEKEVEKDVEKELEKNLEKDVVKDLEKEIEKDENLLKNQLLKKVNTPDMSRINEQFQKIKDHLLRNYRDHSQFELKNNKIVKIYKDSFNNLKLESSNIVYYNYLADIAKMDVKDGEYLYYKYSVPTLENKIHLFTVNEYNKLREILKNEFDYVFHWDTKLFFSFFIKV